MNEFVLIERDGPVVTLTLNDPDRRNALATEGQWDELVRAITTVNNDATVACAILTGAGSAFCSGGNVRDMRDRTGPLSGDGYRIAESYRRGIQRIPLAMHQLDLPIIAAVNGPAIGAGCDLACMCDIRIASDRARFAESFVALGIVPGDGGAWLLQHAIGYSRAAELTFTAETIDASTAAAIGLVSRVVPHESLLDECRSMALRIAANPIPALRMSKRLMREARHARLDAVLELSASMQALAHHTPEHEGAVRSVIARLDARKA